MGAAISKGGASQGRATGAAIRKGGASQGRVRGAAISKGGASQGRVRGEAIRKGGASQGRVRGAAIRKGGASAARTVLIAAFVVGCGAGRGMVPADMPDEARGAETAEAVDEARVIGAAGVAAGSGAGREAAEEAEAVAVAEEAEAVAVAEEAEEAAHIPEAAPDDPCTFTMYNWSVDQRRAVNRRTVRQTRADLAADETDPDDPRCSVCEEDQAEIDPGELGIDGVAPFSVCVHWLGAVEEALREIVADGSFEIRELVGYRPGRTRGRVVDGVRTELSNHSFGTAIDINASWNGLYRRCAVPDVTPESIARCTLGIGGAWDPERHPHLTITRDGVVYRVFTQSVGWRWGGEIPGQTKDMMHFSITGY